MIQMLKHFRQKLGSSNFFSRVKQNLLFSSSTITLISKQIYLVTEKIFSYGAAKAESYTELLVTASYLENFFRQL